MIMDVHCSNLIDVKFNKVLLKDFLWSDYKIALIPCQNYNYLKYWFGKLANVVENSGVEYKVSFSNNMIECVGKKFIFYRKVERVVGYDRQKAVILTNIDDIGK